MTRISRVGPAFVCATVAVLAAIASALGVFARGDGATVVAQTVRGGTYEAALNGVYAHNAQRLVAEGVGWDVFTLIVAAPALLVTAYFAWRGAFNALLVAVGLLGYFLYMYLEYAVTWAFGPLFLLHVVIYGASIVGLAWIAATIAENGIKDRFTERFPRRAWAALSVGMSVLLSVSVARPNLGSAKRRGRLDAPRRDDDDRAGTRPWPGRPGLGDVRVAGVAANIDRLRARRKLRDNICGHVRSDRLDAHLAGM